jgi:large subunit ribosomal protein L5
MVKLQEKFRTELKPALKEKLGYSNIMQVPKVAKVVINMGIGNQVDKDSFSRHVDELALLAGQRPMVTRARKSISNFKLREGMQLGAKVTLRGPRMYDFIERFVNCSLPRIRDFRGLNSRKGFDGRGNWTLGIKDQVIFPELDPDQIKRTQGMDITFITTASTDAEAKELLRSIGIPFAAE